MRALFRQFSFPGGIPSHAAPETPGSIHEGGELGYCARPRLRRRVRQPRPARRLRGRRRRGRDRRRWPRAGTPTSSSTRCTDGAVLPILHLNGYKIANPTVLARIPRRRAGRAAARATATGRTCVEPADETTARCTRGWPTALDEVARRDRRIQADARAHDGAGGPPALADDRAAHARRAGPGPTVVDGVQVEGTFRVAPGAAGRDPRQRRAPRAARGVAALLPAGGAVRRRRPPASRTSPRCAPAGDRRMSANPHANGGALLRDLRLPDFRDYAVDVAAPGRRATTRRRGCSAPGCATSSRRNPRTFRLFGPGRDRVQPAAGASSRSPTARWHGEGSDDDDHLAPGRAGSWRCCPSTCARAGSRATCSPAGTACSTATRRSSTSSTRCSTSTPSGSRSRAIPLAARRSRR